jgi:hypothetical protein
LDQIVKRLENILSAGQAALNEFAGFKTIVAQRCE